MQLAIFLHNLFRIVYIYLHSEKVSVVIIIILIIGLAKKYIWILP